jgi:hypothetical protein
MHRSALIRSATHPHNDHSAGLLYTITGKRADRLESAVPVLPTQAPSMNAVIQYLARGERRDLPASVWMPCYTGWGQGSIRPGLYAGFLGRKYDPFITACAVHSDRPSRSTYEPELVKGKIVLPDLALHPDLTVDRLNRRRTLLGQLEDELRRVDRSGALDSVDTSRRQAFDLLTSGGSAEGAWRAFRVEEEDPRVQDRYGRNLYGHSVLAARRLVERGVRFVTVTWEVFDKLKIDGVAWDTHERNFPVLRDHLLPVLDAAYSALCEDLQGRGLLDETLIVVMGEMGRSPRVNKKGGRDHWSFCYNVLFTGSGVRPGAVYGASDKYGAYPRLNPVGPEAVIATVYAALGIDPAATILDQAGRPQPIAQYGEPVRDILDVDRG